MSFFDYQRDAIDSLRPTVVSQENCINARKAEVERARKDLVSSVFALSKLIEAYLFAIWQETRSQVGKPNASDKALFIASQSLQESSVALLSKGDRVYVGQGDVFVAQEKMVVWGVSDSEGS